MCVCVCVCVCVFVCLCVCLCVCVCARARAPPPTTLRLPQLTERPVAPVVCRLLRGVCCLVSVVCCTVSGALPQLTESSQRRAERLGVAAKSLPPDLAVSAAAMDVTHTLSADKSAVQVGRCLSALRWVARAETAPRQTWHLCSRFPLPPATPTGVLARRRRSPTARGCCSRPARSAASSAGGRRTVRPIRRRSSGAPSRRPSTRSVTLRAPPAAALFFLFRSAPLRSPVRPTGPVLSA